MTILNRLVVIAIAALVLGAGACSSQDIDRALCDTVSSEDFTKLGKISFDPGAQNVVVSDDLTRQDDGLVVSPDSPSVRISIYAEQAVGPNKIQVLPDNDGTIIRNTGDVDLKVTELRNKESCLIGLPKGDAWTYKGSGELTMYVPK